MNLIALAFFAKPDTKNCRCASVKASDAALVRRAD